METHGEKTLECKLCYTKFRISSYLANHQKVVHKSELHLLEKELQEKESTIHTILNNTADAILTFDESGKLNGYGWIIYGDANNE